MFVESVVAVTDGCTSESKTKRSIKNIINYKASAAIFVWSGVAVTDGCSSDLKTKYRLRILLIIKLVPPFL